MSKSKPPHRAKNLTAAGFGLVRRSQLCIWQGRTKAANYAAQVLLAAFGFCISRPATKQEVESMLGAKCKNVPKSGVLQIVQGQNYS